MLNINNIYNCNCIEGLKQLDSNSVDLTVTSPPYDNLRDYNGAEWNFEIFKTIAEELYRVTKPGGIIVWVVGDAVIKGSETGTSFKQALYFKEIGFNLHDTMIYEKNSSSFPARIDSKRYTQIFEYMFIFTKGQIRKDITLIADKRNKWAGWTGWGKHTSYEANGTLKKVSSIKPISEFSLRNNIWKYSVSFNDKTNHPAVFPEQLAQDHILSWSVEGDLVLDPFMGSGTTAKMALLNKRNYIGFEQNKEYYEESLKRVGKYIGDVNNNISGTTWTDSEGNTGTLQVEADNDKELEGKTELWNKIITDLNQYFNEQSLGILKNLKIVFASKANDKRVQEVLAEKQQDNTIINTNDNKEDINDTNNTSTLTSIITEPVLPFEEEDNNKKEYYTPEIKIIDSPEIRNILRDRVEEENRMRDIAKEVYKEMFETYLNVKDSGNKEDIPIDEIRVISDNKSGLRIDNNNDLSTPIKRHRGRPKGSKNKKKNAAE